MSETWLHARWVYAWIVHVIPIAAACILLTRFEVSVSVGLRQCRCVITLICFHVFVAGIEFLIYILLFVFQSYLLMYVGSYYLASALNLSYRLTGFVHEDIVRVMTGNVFSGMEPWPCWEWEREEGHVGICDSEAKKNKDVAWEKGVDEVIVVVSDFLRDILGSVSYGL